MRSLVTGGAGFIGSHLVDALLRRGDEVVVLDDLSSGRRSNLSGALEHGVRLIEGSLTDGDLVVETIGDSAPRNVFHLAAQADVRRAVADPGFDAAVNVLGTINVLEAVRTVPGAAVIFASTGGAIYGEGENRELPFTELAEAAPLAPYGASKLAAEVYLSLYRRLHGIPTVALRLGNVYGPRQDPNGEAGVVAIFCGLLKEDRGLKIYGDGNQTRDYVFVGDVVEAFLAAARRLAGGGAEAAGPYNIGTGIETSVNDLASRLEDLAGSSSGFSKLAERGGEVKRVAIDPKTAERDLGWTATTELEAGLRTTLAAVDRQSPQG